MPGKIRDRGRSVVHVGQDDEGELRVQDPFDVGDPDAVDVVLVDPADLEAAAGGEALDDVAIGRELVPADRDGMRGRAARPGPPTRAGTG